MTFAYWKQFDREDLDSWKGYDDHDERDVCKEGSCSCCKVNPCGNCMDCLGLSWRDFM